MEHFMQIWNFFPSAFQLILNVKNIFRILSFMRPKKWKYSNNDLNRVVKGTEKAHGVTPQKGYVILSNGKQIAYTVYIYNIKL